MGVGKPPRDKSIRALSLLSGSMIDHPFTFGSYVALTQKCKVLYVRCLKRLYELVDVRVYLQNPETLSMGRTANRLTNPKKSNLFRRLAVLKIVCQLTVS